MDLVKFNQATNLARSGEKKQARVLFNELLLDNPKDKQLWLWMSFCAEDLDSKIFDLDKALELDPNNLKVLQERQRLINKKSNEQFGPCPFCGGIVDTTTLICQDCKNIIVKCLNCGSYKKYSIEICKICNASDATKVIEKGEAKKDQVSLSNEKTNADCPYCQGYVDFFNLRCNNCGSIVTRCSFCGAYNKTENSICRSCNTKSFAEKQKQQEFVPQSSIKSGTEYPSANNEVVNEKKPKFFDNNREIKVFLIITGSFIVGFFLIVFIGWVLDQFPSNTLESTSYSGPYADYQTALAIEHNVYANADAYADSIKRNEDPWGFYFNKGLGCVCTGFIILFVIAFLLSRNKKSSK